MRKIIIESPYAAGIGIPGLIGRWMNRRYARACVRDSLKRGEAPIASHLLYTQRGILKDNESRERQLGIAAGLAWRFVADATVVYVDRGISSGMRYGIAAMKGTDKPVEYRTLKQKAEGFHGLPHMWPENSPEHPSYAE